MDQAWIMRAFALMQDNLHHDRVLETLVAEGCGLGDAQKLIVFLPIACNRACLAGSGASFSSHYRLMPANGAAGRRLLLADDFDWVAIEGFVKTEIAVSRDAVGRIAPQSAEFEAINKALNAGSKLENLVGSDAIVALPSASGSAARLQSQPWWAFWRR